MAECPDSTPTKSIERVCVSPSLKEQICLLCAKVVSNSDFRRKLTTSGGQKTTKTCLTLESTLGKEISSDCFFTNILCRNCGIYLNETLARKLHGVRESLESSRKAITEEKGGITSVKRQAQDSARGTSKQKRNKRALFVVGDDPPSTNNLIAALLCRDATTQVGFEDFLEEENILTEVIIHFPNSPSRRIAVYEDKARVIRQLCLGSIESVVNTLLQNKEWQSIVYDKVSNLITMELTGLCVL
ncbi:unnamed protein product [Porites lobata]|uniref:Uncharacterized protein n=1 Tax=Porites lobata TaxID=104759 RepID=A0ABN8N1R1_9CNID|nr:unnamed protein product [Porites lobata]